MTKPVVCVIGTGGTISCIAESPLDTLNYPEFNTKLDAASLLGALPEIVSDTLELRALSFASFNSTLIGPPEWRALAGLIESTAQAEPAIAGFVVMHGTATLEETAYLLNLVLRIEQPVVITGAQRPHSALSADGPMNLVAACRTAAAPAARGMGVLVVLNDEIHDARDVTKTSTYRLDTFRSPQTGPLGVVDGDGVHFHRRPLRRHTIGSLFDRSALAAPPRVDIAYSYAGADGVAVQAFLQAGAAGLVSAGMLPGMTSPAEFEALRSAQSAGCVVVQAARGGSGRIARRRALVDWGFVASDGLNAQKSRILLLLSLSRTRDATVIQEIFDTH